MKGKNFSINFSKQNGALNNYVWNDKQIINQSLLPHFTRPLTDNDKRGWKADTKLKQWFADDLKLVNIDATTALNGSVIVKTNYSLINDSATVQVVFTVNGNGVVKVDYTLQVKDSLPNIPKVGMQCGIEKSFTQIDWYGKGLLENYIDRSSGFPVGIYSQPLKDFMEPYVVPQENGNRTDVRWMYLHNNQKQGLLIAADSLLSMSAWPYTEKNIEEARHTIKLKDAGFITLNIDLMQMGVGGNDSWSDVAAPLEQFQIKAKPYSYRFYILPFVQAKESVTKKVRDIKF